MANNHINEDYLILAAEMYYLDGMSQSQIAERLHCSRTNVTRMLKMCVDNGIVEFKIKKPTSERVSLKNKLERIFSLNQVIIVPSRGTHTQIISRVGEATASYLDSVMDDGVLIGAPYGSTIYQVVTHFSPTRRYKADIIQLVGGLSVKDSEFDGQYIVKALQSKLDGTEHLLHAPFIVKSEESRNILLDEIEIKNHFEFMKKTDIALVGIGSTRSTFSSIHKAGHLTKEEADNLFYQGAIADLCGSQIDEFGRQCKTPISGRVVGISLDDLSKIPVRIGCAAGLEKASAILGTLRGNYLNVLVIDEEAAAQIITILSPGEKSRIESIKGSE